MVASHRPDRVGAPPPGLDPPRARRSRPAPRPSWRTRPAGPNSSASRRARSASPTRAAWRCWIRVEAGQLDRAAVLAADLTEQAERHGFDMLAAVRGQPCRPPSAPWPALDADDPDPTGLSAHIATMTTLPRHLAHGRDERLHHLLRRRPRAAVDRRRPTRAGPRPPGHRTAAGPGHRDALLRRRTAAAARPHPHRPRRPRKPTSPPPSNSPAARARPCSNCAPPSTISSCAASPRALPSPTRSAASPPTARCRNWRGPRPRRSRPTRNSGSSAASRSGGRSLGIPDPTTSSVSCGKRHPRSLPEATDSLSPQSRRLGAASPGVMLPPQ